MSSNVKTVTRKTYSFSVGRVGTSSYISYENACQKLRPGGEFHNNGIYYWTCGGANIDAGSPYTTIETITMPMQSTTNEVVDYILSVERFEANAYLPTPNDCWTIGYGSTFYADGSPVRQGDTITRDAAAILFKETLRKTENDVNEKVTVYLNDNQFSALVSFLYNVGIGNFNSSTLLQKLNNLDYKGAADEFPRWNKQNGVVLNGLTIRRAHEQSIFNK